MWTDLLDLAYREPGLADLDPAQRRLRLRELVAAHVSDTQVPAALTAIADEIDGCGVLSRLVEEPRVTDILVNAPDDVWVERDGRLERTDTRFEDAGALWSLAERLIGDAGARIDASCPIADARLLDGSRVHIAIPPAAPDGPIISIRRFPAVPLDLEELERLGMMSATQAERLLKAVRERASIVISGATGTGKTTILNALLASVGDDERIVTLEETPELRPSCAHRVSLVARHVNLEGTGEIGLDELLRASLRMRPDRIVVGEVRGSEALIALAAFSTGHRGSMVTIHARSARAALDKLVSLSLEAASGASEELLHRRAVDAFDLLVHLDRIDGRRAIAEIVATAELG